jgi:pyrimidine and pyridine-specific 5'-nucleotidase
LTFNIAAYPTLTVAQDDSYANAKGAHAFGWHSVHYVEPELDEPIQKAADYQIRHLAELRDLFPQFFKTQINGALKT